MTPLDDNLPRWRETSMDPSALPARAADLADAARDVPALPPEALARIKVGVLAQRPSRARGLPLGLRFAMLTAVLLMGAATAKGTMLLWRRYAVASVPAPAATPERRHATHRPRGPVAPVIEPLAPAFAPEAASVAEPAPAPAAEPTPTPTPPAPRTRRVAMVERRAPAVPRADRATTEAQLLADALSRLRQAHDARGALALLDQYASTFPRGVLAGEARSARLEAVLQLGDRGAALRLLDERTAFAGRLGAEQLLTRAELRASAGRYADALVDFERLLAPGAGAPPPADVERALYGRAVSLGHLHRDDRARADLVDYQRRFPSGRHAGEVARLLKGAGATEARP